MSGFEFTKNRGIAIRPNAYQYRDETSFNDALFLGKGDGLLDFSQYYNEWPKFQDSEKKVFPHKEALTTESGVLALYDQGHSWFYVGKEFNFRTYEDGRHFRFEGADGNNSGINYNCWLASQSQSNGIAYCLKKISENYACLHPPIKFYDTWESKRSTARLNTVYLTGPGFLDKNLEEVDRPKPTTNPKRVEDFIVLHAYRKKDEPKTDWREVDIKNSRASESPF